MLARLYGRQSWNVSAHVYGYACVCQNPNNTKQSKTKPLGFVFIVPFVKQKASVIFELSVAGSSFSAKENVLNIQCD